LVDLIGLGLSGNQIRQLPSSIGELNQLRLLDLGNNPLTSLPKTIGSLRALTHLYLWGAEFEEVPPVLRTLTNLQVLDLSRRGTSDLRTEREDNRRQSREDLPVMTWTRMVGSSATPNSQPVTSLPEWLPNAFPDLRWIYLGGHQIRKLPAALSVLGHLQGLYLSGNRLDAFPEAILDLPELRQLDLRENRITEVPAGLQRLQKLEYLDLAGNPLPIPPEVLARPDDPTAILEYASGIEQATQPLDEAKLLVVGEGSVGKTSLIKRLVYNQYTGNEGKTEGIDVTHWEILADGHNISLNTWDFGGQEIMHATHQFFLTKRSIYVLVIDARQGEEQNRVEYWLKLIQSFSDRSPVIIVGNKSDQAVLDIDRRGLRAKYDNIVEIISVSCLDGKGIDEVKEVLARTVGHLSHVRDLLPTAFFEIKQFLEELEVNYLPFGEYEQLAEARASSRRVHKSFLSVSSMIWARCCASGTTRGWQTPTS
jgi:internalin A